MSMDFEQTSPRHPLLDQAARNRARFEEALERMGEQLSLYIALIAVLALVFVYISSATHSQAAQYQSNAAVLKSAAAHQWQQYQAKTQKQAISELARDFSSGDKVAIYQAKVDRYDKEKAELKTVADDLDAQATSWEHKATAQSQRHYRWAQASLALLLGIATAAITLFTKKRELSYVAYGLGGVGGVVALLALFGI